MSNYTYRPCHQDEKEAVTDVFFATQEALRLPNRAAAAKITERLFDSGHVLGGYHNNKLVGVLGYFLGEPMHNFTNNDVLYLYVGAILPEYRMCNPTTGISNF